MHSKSNYGRVLFVTCLSTSLVPLMASALSLALPFINRDLSLSANMSGWVLTSYLLSTAIFQIPSARLADIFGRRKIFLCGIAVFFIFSVLLGASLQITNGYANPFLDSFKSVPEYADTFGVQHSNILISLSQASEALCILMIPFFLKRYGIKTVMLIAMVAWVLRFGLFGLGDPGDGVWMFVLSMLVYGVAFDFFNISGSLFIDKETTTSMRSSAQGIFILMTNGVGATVGTLGAQAVVNSYIDMDSSLPQNEQWSHVWFIFAAYALVVAIAFAVLFRYKHDRTPVKQ